MAHDPMRRRDKNRLQPVERMLLEGMVELENIGADPRLTDAVFSLGKARESLADYYDDVPCQYGERNPKTVLTATNALTDGYKARPVGNDGPETFLLLKRGVIDPKTVLKD